MTAAELTDRDIRDKIGQGRRCQLCREQSRPGGALCWGHHDELGRILDPDYRGERDLDRAGSIPVLWDRLDPTPATSGLGDRRAPGFASTPPCNLTVVAMRDDRSVSWPVVAVWYEALWPGISNARDLDHPHFEDESPPRAIAKSVAGLADWIWDDLGYPDFWIRLGLPGGPPPRSVADHCYWLYRHLNDLTGREDAGRVHRDLSELHTQLRRAAGDPAPRPVAACTGWVRDPDLEENVECGWPLYLPPPRPGVKIEPSRPVLRCGRCDRPYTTLMLLRLEVVAERRAD